MFRGGFALGYLWPLDVIGCNAGTPLKIVIFRELGLGHFGQQAPESPASQLQNGVSSTSSLSPVWT